MSVIHRSPALVLTQWRPGSCDCWTWFDEARDVFGELADPALFESVATHGVREPILLGDDGRVWDGHHRLLYAAVSGQAGVPTLDVGSRAPRTEP